MPDPRTELRTELGAPPPEGLVAALDDRQLWQLAATLRDVRRRQAEELEAAGAKAIEHVPKLLRGPVRRAVGAR